MDTRWKLLDRCALLLVLAVSANPVGAQGPAGGAHAGITLGPHTAADPAGDAGELLLGELNCTACHGAEPAVLTRLNSRRAPRLGEGGLKLTPQFLREWLANPQAVKPGTVMPDVLHGLPAGARTEAGEALAHFITSLHSTNAGAVVVVADSFKIDQGRRLYHAVGCVACHAPQEPATLPDPKTPLGVEEQRAADATLAALQQDSVPLGDLARKTTVPELAKFLQDPLKSRPSGRMPSMNLTETEATAIAMYLLRGQVGAAVAGSPRPRMKGLSYQYLEGKFSSTDGLDRGHAQGSGTVEKFTLTPKLRTTGMGFRFTGFLTAPVAGSYTFWVASDDGSRLFLNGREVVENDGEHGTTEKSGQVDLPAGEHSIAVLYWNGGGGAELKVSWAGPGWPKQEIPSSALSTDQGETMAPPGREDFIVEAGKASRGRELFGSLGCASCHQTSGEPVKPSLSAKALAALDAPAVEGCLGARPGTGAPKFGLSDGQRAQLSGTLANRGKLSQPLAAPAQVTRTLAALNCLACHTRDSLGGPVPARAEYFKVLGSEDLGDEGRLPPHLTGVGGKLRPEWLREVLGKKGAARPYMATRMPQFGASNVEALAGTLEQADGPPAADKPTNPGDAKWGRKLAGTGGLSCISCHTFAGHKSLGIPAMDLALMTKRLRKDWFHRYLYDPPSLRPGTRMPTFWPEGKSANTDVLGGDAHRQIDSLWAFLSRGTEAGLPPGLVQGKMEVVATNEPVIYRNFIAGAGPRAIGVGYPEHANLAWDANDLRLALIWQGPFIDAAIHRVGRGSGFAPPLGYNVVSLPAGAPFAALADTNAPWPSASGVPAGYRMGGYSLDAKRRPVFLFSFGAVEVEDALVPVTGDSEGTFVRTLTLRTGNAPQALYFRAWAGAKLEAQPEGVWLADGKMRLKFTGGGQPLARSSGGKRELLVPVVFTGGVAQIVEEIVW